MLNDQDDYTKNRNYWKYLKTKLKKEENELVSVTNQLKLLAPDGKRRLTDIPWRCIGRFRGHGPDFLAEMTSDCLAKTEHSHPLGMVVSTHFRCGKGVKRGLKNGALPFNID